MGVELEPGQGGCYEARVAGCTCTWLRGFGVDQSDLEKWTERILEQDEQCQVHARRGTVR